MNRFNKLLDSSPFMPFLVGAIPILMVAIGLAIYYHTPQGKAYQHEVYVEGCKAGRIEPNKCLRSGVNITWKVTP